VALRPLISQVDALDEAIGALDREIAASVKVDATAKRLMTIPGVGPVTASAIVATIQDAARTRPAAKRGSGASPRWATATNL
jgi:transposase